MTTERQQKGNITCLHTACVHVRGVTAAFSSRLQDVGVIGYIKEVS